MEKSTAKIAMKTILVVIKDNQVLTMMSGKSSEFLSFRIFKRNILNIFDREIAQALAVLQVAIVSIDFKRFVYTDLDD